MEEYKDISRGLKMLLGKAEEMGSWTPAKNAGRCLTATE